MVGFVDGWICGWLDWWLCSRARAVDDFAHDHDREETTLCLGLFEGTAPGPTRLQAQL
jgi:hypothetical protein